MLGDSNVNMANLPVPVFREDLSPEEILTHLPDISIGNGNDNYSSRDNLLLLSSLVLE